MRLKFDEVSEAPKGTPNTAPVDEARKDAVELEDDTVAEAVVYPVSKGNDEPTAEYVGEQNIRTTSDKSLTGIIDRGAKETIYAPVAGAN